MKFQNTMLSAVLAVSAFMSVAITAPSPAAADEVGTDAAIGAALGAIAGQLLFDSNRDQYYYVHEHRRVYVRDRDARGYFARRDPGFYRGHQRDFDRDPGRFSREWDDHSRHGQYRDDRDGGDRHDHDSHNNDHGWQNH